jgi:hypothetical protein
MQAPGHLLLDARLFQADLAGEPEQVDLVAEVVDQGDAFARRPARRFEIDEQA